jgi:hypothetical protein
MSRSSNLDCSCTLLFTSTSNENGKPPRRHRFELLTRGLVDSPTLMGETGVGYDGGPCAPRGGKPDLMRWGRGGGISYR